MKHHAIYPGSFDPLTNGHINMVERATKIFASVTVAVAQNSSKPKIFSLEERLEMLKVAFKDFKEVKVESFEGLLVNYVKEKEGHTVIRGIRSNADFEYELALAHANKHLDSTMETVFMMTDPQYAYLSSSMIREIIHLGGTTKGMLPDFIEKRLQEKLLEKK